MEQSDLVVESPDGPAFTLPRCFPPSHGIRGEGGRTTYRAETAAIVEGYRNLLIDIIVPARSDDERVPVVVWIHGGAFVMGSSEEVWSPWWQAMREKVLAAGLAFASLTYRFSSEAPFPAQLVDVKAGLRYLRHFAPMLGLDGQKVALWGGSAGAQLALLAALTPGVDVGEPVGVDGPDEPVCGVVDFYGPTDVTSMPNSQQAGDDVLARLLGGPVDEMVELARAASPITHLHSEAPPVLAFHGTMDGAVPIGQSQSFVERARALNLDAALVEVEAADHGFATIDMGDVLDQSIAFLQRCLLGVVPAKASSIRIHK